MGPLVSVIIPSYNHSQYIAQAIDSILNQDYENIELLVVDDGSSDNTSEVLSRLPFNDKLTIITNKVNRGQSAVLNQALSLAKGEYICLLPSDDWYLPGKISLQVKKFLECDQDTGVVYGRGARYFPSTGEIIEIDLPMYHGWVLEKLIREGNFVYPVTPMFKKECFDFAQPDESYRAEGEAIYLKLAIKYKFDFVKDAVAVMRDHEYNTGKNLEMMLIDNNRYWREFFMRDDIPLRIKKLKNPTLARLHRGKGLELIAAAKNTVLARDALLRAIRLGPYYAFDYKVVAALLISFLPIKVVSILSDFRADLENR